ncbi:MAG: VapC toxin family PIN domain ribonuclease [Candidatus Parabeggiatoa sp. nov. 2]|nr:MAG: VapC toxin family PIN domain ribonuclease [Beggiatoa sp. 4572_84]RKZ60748.1 MAG: VapC toxin family PIN domain ribonuclease [Gammaproteobacteria bacterium]
MKIKEAFDGVNRVFLDTAPVIYSIEKNPHYLAIANYIFDELIEKQTLLAVTSPVTLAECLVVPIRDDQTQLQQDFIEFLTENSNILLEIIDKQIGKEAAKFRAQYNLTLSDALQVAVALQANCDALLTNDIVFKRVTELPIIVLGELER